ncbi:hypothetical protein GTW51_11340 [Aurantimonas aggregata]|uniref:Uncharacterized protein n=1 Tax=Aurantimonas aggregata TaxID=2047720 RepID=A0A6L9MHG0_9HYPH|nr:hypothetical protein [Aurantimonas aggregata]NDV87293.1 hypothetical protein [Aurantimonas aggregata]
MLRSSVIAATLFAACLPAGHAEPLLVRTVTLGGVTGAGYYSRVEQGYRFVGGRPLEVAAEGDPIAVSALEGGDTAMDADAGGAR